MDTAKYFRVSYLWQADRRRRTMPMRVHGVHVPPADKGTIASAPVAPDTPSTAHSAHLGASLAQSGANTFAAFDKAAHASSALRSLCVQDRFTRSRTKLSGCKFDIDELVRTHWSDLAQVCGSICNLRALDHR